MALIRLFWNSAAIIRWQFLLLAMLSAASNAGVLMLISIASRQSGTTLGALRNVVLFVLAIAIFALSQRRLMSEISLRIEGLIDNIRLDLLARAQASEALQIEAVGQSELYNALSRSTQVISQVTPNLVIAVQSFILLVLASLYILYLSAPAFWCWFALIVATVGIAIYRSGNSKRMLADVSREETRLLSGFSDIFDGFRELKVSSAKMHDVVRDIKSTSKNAKDKKIDFQMLFATDYTVATTLFYSMAGLMAFIVPILMKSDSQLSTSLTMASLFMLGPVGNVAYSASLLQQANAAASQIEDLNGRLAPSVKGEQSDAERTRIERFERLDLRSACFRYDSRDGDHSFSVGPLDLSLTRGEVVFITGGNGSGKSTFVSLLLDLYPLSGGGIWLDDVPIGRSNRAAYRDLFAVIFANNHLFSRLYGLTDVCDGEARDLIRLLELESKVTLSGGVFSTTKLSSGQRKRLALIAAMLEHKDIYVFDEWAADQDPYFRSKFYNEIIPHLKAQGSTVLAITHDEKYFDLCDRRLHMQDGLLCEVPNRIKKYDGNRGEL